MKMFLLLCFVYIVIFETQNGRRSGKKPDHKVTNLESQFYLFLD